MYARNGDSHRFYHELQLPYINNYYDVGNLKTLNNNNNTTTNNNSYIDEKMTIENSFLEQTDLNDAYKISNKRCQRTSYNMNFFDIEKVLLRANSNSNNDNSLDSIIMSNNNKPNETNVGSKSYLENRRNPQVIKRSSWFTEQLSKANSTTDQRKSFWRPKTPMASLDERRRMSRQVPNTTYSSSSNQLNAAKQFETIAKRTDNLIEVYRKHYENT